LCPVRAHVAARAERQFWRLAKDRELAAAKIARSPSPSEIATEPAAIAAVRIPKRKGELERQCRAGPVVVTVSSRYAANSSI
jgi:hypothetical protein